jgi:hypothetical protein
MKALGMWQPFAWLLAYRQQRGITFRQEPRVSGVVALYASPAPSGYLDRLDAARRDAIARAMAFPIHESRPLDHGLPIGAVVGFVQLSEAVVVGRLVRGLVEFAHGPRELLLSNYTDGRYLTAVDEACALSRPIRCARESAPGLPFSPFFDLPRDVDAEIAALAPTLVASAPFRRDVERLTSHPDDLR